MNMPMLMAVNPTHLLDPAESSGITVKVVIGIFASRF